MNDYLIKPSKHESEMTHFVFFFRYYKTERRASFIGDVSSGTNRDFRYYSYRPVPYFGGSDHYQYVDRILKCINKTIDYPQWYDIK